MFLFSKVMMCCNTCGTTFLTNFQVYGGRFCGPQCHEEYNLRHATAVMGFTVDHMQEKYIPSLVLDKVK